MQLALYSNDSSYYSMIARLVMAEKNVIYTMHKIDIHIKMEQFRAQYIKIQPNMTVPTLVSDNTVINGSDKILFFINEHFPTPDLYPADDQEAIQKSLELHYSFSIEDLTMGKTMRKSPIARFALSRGLKRAANRCKQLIISHPEFKTACEKKLDLEQQRYQHILSKQNNYNQVLQQAINLCDMLESELSHHSYAASNNYSLADVVWTVFLARLFMIGSNDLVTKRKNLYAYWQKMTTRPSYAKADIWTKMPKSVLFKIMLALLFKS